MAKKTSSLFSAFPNSLTFSWVIWPGLLAVVLDQAIKALSAARLRPNQSVSLFDENWFYWTRVPNSGLIYQHYEMLYRPENALWTRYIPSLALIVVAYVFKKVADHFVGSDKFKALLIGFSLFWFGGASNILSHFRSVFVDDTFSARCFPGGRFYTFNFADVSITLGMLVVFVVLILAIWTELRQCANT